jgi:hypothetical protein
VEASQAVAAAAVNPLLNAAQLDGKSASSGPQSMYDKSLQEFVGQTPTNAWRIY